MKVLLIRPKAPKETIGLQNVMICEPLELEYISSLIEMDGHQVTIVDMILEKKSLSRIVEDFQPDIAGITAYITHVNMVCKYAEQIKKVMPFCKIAVGGVHAEVVPYHFINSSIDYILQGNSLETFRNIVNGLAKGIEDFSQENGIYSDKNQHCIKHTSFHHPWPDRTKTKQYRHRYYYMFHYPCALIKSSFGCPFQCSFCFCRQITDGRYFERQIQDVLDEISEIDEQEVYIVDDNFLVSSDRVLDFCNGLRAKGLEKHFLIYGRADFIANNEAVIEEFASCGLRAVIVGLESFSDNELKGYNKNSSIQINEQAVAILKKYGVDCYATLILGLDWDENHFNQLAMWLKKLELRFINLQPFTPLPGTSMFDEYKDDLIIAETAFEKWDLAHLTVKPSRLSVGRYYYNIIKLYYRITMSPGNIFIFIKKYGWRQNIKLLCGIMRITYQYLLKMLIG